MKINTRKILIALTLVLTLLVSVATITASAAEGSTVSLDPGEWNKDGARFAIYTWDGGEQWFDMTDDNSDGIFECILPDGISNIIFVRLAPDSINDWTNKWAQTNDLTLKVGGTYIIDTPNGGDVKASGHWDGEEVGGETGGEYSSLTVAGVAGLCGSEWNVSDTANDMTYNEKTGKYELTITGVPAGSYECKVAANHGWDMSWGTPDNGEFGNYVIEIFEEQNVTIIFDPVTCTVSHTVAPSTGADPDRPAPPTVDFENCGKITIYVGDGANWGSVLVHAWVEGSTDIPYTTWPGLEMEWDSDKMLYFIELPNVCDSVVFNNGNGVQSADLVIPNNGAVYDNATTMWSDIKDYTPPIPPENTSDDVTVYVKDDAGWGDVYIYYWDVDGKEFYSFPGMPMDLGDDGYYYATIPAGQYCVLFSNGGSWEDGTLLQTPDLIIPKDNKVYMSNGNSCLYDEAVGNDNDAWHALGGENEGENDGNQGETPDVPTDNDEAPKKEMTFLQKMAKALLLFLRSIEDFFKGLFKKN